MDQEDKTQMVNLDAPPAAGIDDETDATSDPVKKPKGGGKKKAARKRARRRRQIIAWTLAGLVIAGLAASTIVLALDGGSNDNSLRKSATAAARQYAIDFSTYDYRNLDPQFDKIMSTMTPTFRAQYQQTVGQLKSLVVQYRGSATGTVQAIGVTSVDSKTAVVVVFLDQKVSNVNLKAPRVDPKRALITLKRSHGQWLVDSLVLK